jgi:hypothetical protein
MKYIITSLGLMGVICWYLVYMLLIYRGLKDKTYGMPLLPLALDLGFEFVYSFCFPINLFSQVTNLLWFVLDLGIVYTYFKYGYTSFNKFYHLEKRQWYFVSILAFVIGFLIIFFGHQFLTQYLNHFPSGEILVFIVWLILIVISVCMLAMFFQRGNSQGQSFLIIGLIIVGNLFFIFQMILSPTYYKWNNPFLILVITISMVIEFYYAKLLYKQLRKEGINPWKRL